MGLPGAHTWAKFPPSLNSEGSGQTPADSPVVFLALLTESGFPANATSETVSHKPRANSTARPPRAGIRPELLFHGAKIMGSTACVTFP